MGSDRRHARSRRNGAARPRDLATLSGSDDQVRATIELADATRANVAIAERAFQLQMSLTLCWFPDVDPKIAWKPASDGIATVTLEVQNVGNGVAEIVKLEVSCAAEASGQPTMDRVLPSGARATIEADFQFRPPRQMSGAPSTWTGQPDFPAWPSARLDYKGVDGRVSPAGSRGEKQAADGRLFY